MEEPVRFVSYGKKQERLVESGIDNLSMALYNESEEEKASILLCLDKYLDPYYGCRLPYQEDIIILLQNILFEDNSREIREDILDLLMYSDQPLPILEQNLHKLTGELLDRARYVLSEG